MLIFGGGQRGGGEECGEEGLAAGEAGVDFVPVGDFGLAELPAEVDFAAIEPGGEVLQAEDAVLGFHA